jgi:septal ring factor EnvC (AmiA/AmiB activator)
VSAVAAGRVEVARDLPGWGTTVVIDHGDHYHSVYASCARIKVREGDEITSGQLIGFTGERSPLFGPGLYFELRHFADAIDPRTWIKDPNFTTAERN